MGAGVDGDEVDDLVGERLLQPEQVANVVVGDHRFELDFDADNFCVSSVDDEVNLVPPIMVAEVGQLGVIRLDVRRLCAVQIADVDGGRRQATFRDGERSHPELDDPAGARVEGGAGTCWHSSTSTGVTTLSLVAVHRDLPYIVTSALF